jgi:hypothetical protein
MLATVALLAGAGFASGASVRGAPQTDQVRRVVVPARANIFGAGQPTPPDPGGGGRGVPPREIRLPAGARTVTFPAVRGRVNPVASEPRWHGPEGEVEARTDITSFGGISGIVHRTGMFLTGVFVTDARPAPPAPPRLDFTARGVSALAPRIGQTFLIGGGYGRRYRVPAGATRLYLGFADAFFYMGKPGWYDNNAGRVVATVRIAVR